MIRWLKSLVQWSRQTQDQPETRPDLIVSFDVFIEAKCECGSGQVHMLNIASRSECARCGKVLGVRSVAYQSTGPYSLPIAHVTVGYASTEEAFGRLPTSGGVH